MQGMGIKPGSEEESGNDYGMCVGAFGIAGAVVGGAAGAVIESAAGGVGAAPAAWEGATGGAGLGAAAGGVLCGRMTSDTSSAPSGPIPDPTTDDGGPSVPGPTTGDGGPSAPSGPTDGTEGSGGQSGGDDGKPNPFGEAGMPDPEGSGGGSPTALTAGGISLTSATYAMGPGVDQYIARTGSSFSLQSMPQLTFVGQQLQLSNAGILAAIPEIANQFANAGSVASHLSNARDVQSGIQDRVASQVPTSSASQEALRFIGEGVARSLATGGHQISQL